MTAQDLPNEDNIVRYARPKQVRDGEVDGTAFILREVESGLSVNWLNYFEGMAKAEQLDEVRRLIRLKVSPNGRFAELNVGTTLRQISGELSAIRVVRSPLDAEGSFEADPSHSEVLGLPSRDTAEAEMIGDMLAECIERVHSGTSGSD